MRRPFLIFASLLAMLAMLVVAPAASAATKTVSIKRSSFSPSTVGITAGDTIRWRNDDTRHHQVVSTTGTFASPVLAPGRSYSFKFEVAGTYRYRDALVPTSVGTVKVAGAPPAVTLATSLPAGLVRHADHALQGRSTARRPARTSSSATWRTGRDQRSCSRR